MQELGRTLFAALLLLLPSRLDFLSDSSLAAVPRPVVRIVRGIVPAGASLATALAAHVSPTAIHALVEAARPVHDLSRVVAGRPFGLALQPGGLVHAFTYDLDELRTLRLTRRDGILQPEIVEQHYATEVVAVAGQIESSLFASVEELGEGDQLALDLAEIFAWDIDFHTEIQRGDSFRLVVEKLALDGAFRRYGRILAAEFHRGDRTLYAIHYSGPGGSGHFDLTGRPLRRGFLRSPLKFGRITSRFTHARLHPILKIVRPHLGIDYAAPIGTPVLAIGDGVVTSAGWLGGYGRTVRLRHANGIETLYGHLSAVRVRPGQRVTQSTVIGTVGASGLTTGPHLDYRMFRSRVPVNPLRVDIPPAPPLDPGEAVAFAELRERALGLLRSRAAPAQARVLP